jgi:hypothetical protein
MFLGLLIRWSRVRTPPRSPYYPLFAGARGASPLGHRFLCGCPGPSPVRRAHLANGLRGLATHRLFHPARRMRPNGHQKSDAPGLQQSSSPERRKLGMVRDAVTEGHRSERNGLGAASARREKLSGQYDFGEAVVRLLGVKLCKHRGSPAGAVRLKAQGA